MKKGKGYKCGGMAKGYNKGGKTKKKKYEPMDQDKMRREKQERYERNIGHAGAQKDASKSLKKFRDNMTGDAYDRSKGKKPKYGPGYNKGGKVDTYCSHLHDKASMYKKGKK
jgi:hypothetical protein